jgi:hypothetical protein
MGAALVLACLRLWNLGGWSLWIDEALTVADFHLIQAGAGDQHYNPWAYQLLGRVAEAFGGMSDPFSLRLLPALAGLLSIPLACWALTPLAGRRPAALAALFVALSSWHLYWSQTARFYTLALCLSLAGAGLFLRGLRSSSPQRCLLGLLLTATAAGAQLQGGLFLVALALSPLVLLLLKVPFPGTDRRTKTVLLVALVLAVFGVGWAWGSWSTYLAQKPAASTLHLVLTTGYHMTPALLGAAALGAILAWRRREAGALLVVTLLTLAVAAALVLSRFALLSAQYLFLLLPWVAFLAAWPLSGTRPGMMARTLTVLVLVSGAVGCWRYATVRGADRPPWRAAWNYVADHAGEDDLVSGMAAPVGEYYLNPSHRFLRRPVRVAWIDEHRPRVPEPWPRRGRRAWVVLNREYLVKWALEDRDRFTRLLEDRGHLAARFPRALWGRDMSVEVWRLGD